MSGLSKAKHVTVSLSRIDCLPGHVTIRETGTGGTVAIAARRAVEKALKNIKLKYRQPRQFDARFTVTLEKEDSFGHEADPDHRAARSS